MIKLTVQSYNGAPLPQSLAAQFDELGGTIGRADNNQLVLPDPERSISRVHAQVAFRNGVFAIIDRGSNPVLINGQPLGNGVEGTIKQGDKLQIGGYVIAVDSAMRQTGGASSSASADPFGDPFADLGGMAFGAPSAKPSAPAARTPASTYATQATTKHDPFAGLAAGGTNTSGAKSAAGGIPDDWDPFAPDAPAAGSSDLSRQLGSSGNDFGLEVGGAAPQPLIPGMGDLGGGKANSSSSLDAMFGLSSGGDPLANSILAPAAMAPNMSNHADPMRSLDSISAGSSTVAPDNVSALNQPFLGAPLQKSKAPTIPDEPLIAASPTPQTPLTGAVLSWDDGGGSAERTVIRGSGASRARQSAVAMTPSVPSAPAAPDIPLDVPMPTPTPAPRASMAGPADQEALIQALKQGLGMPGLQMQSLTPEFMLLLGQLLHESAGGTVDLLVARQTLKREVQAEMTMISTKGNNPLKFSPSAEVALNYLLNPTARGFMPAQQAMKDAYNDLRAHQVAFVAGVKSALEGVIKRFDPEVLESKLTQKSKLAALLPASRKARMWDVFAELYGQISSEANEDFHELFGEEFKRAYDEHIQQLKRNG